MLNVGLNFVEEDCIICHATFATHTGITMAVFDLVSVECIYLWEIAIQAVWLCLVPCDGRYTALPVFAGSLEASSDIYMACLPVQDGTLTFAV